MECKGDYLVLNSYLLHRMADKKIYKIAQLAELSGVSFNTISKLYYEKDMNTLKLDTLIKLCDVLDCTLSELVEYKKDC